MSEELEDGGAAYPEPIVVKGNIVVKARTAHGYLGITVRDYFASHALTAIIAKSHAVDANKEQIVREAFRYADFMLAERKNKPRGSQSRKGFDG